MSSYKLGFIADLHYYSPMLGTTGRAYDLRQGSDQKCLAETGSVFDAAAKVLTESDVQAVCIAGDITNDGEKCSHDGIFEKFSALNEKKKVYLITSTHDWCSDGNPRRFEGKEIFHDVPTVSREEIDGIYSVFGKDEEIASFTTPQGFTSRVYKLSDELRLFAVNDDCDGRGGKSGYSEGHLQWMKDQLKKAKDEGACVIAMEHHLMLFNLAPLINKGQSIADNYEIAAQLADAGLRLLFVGHSHMQRTTEFVSPAGNKITQVNIGSLSGHPAPINFVTVENGKAKVDVHFLEGFDHEGKHFDSRFFKEHTSAVLYNLLNAAATDKEDLRERLGADGIKIKPLDKIYPIIRWAAKKILKIKVGQAGRLVNFFTFGKGVDRKAVKAVKNDLLLDHVIDIFLNVFDGSATAKGQKEEVKKIAIDVSTLPRRVITKLPLKKGTKKKIAGITEQIESLVNELMYPSAPDNLHFTVEL